MQLQNLTYTDIFTRFRHVSASKMKNIQVQDWEFIGDWNSKAWHTRTAAILLPISVNMAVALGMNLD